MSTAARGVKLVPSWEELETTLRRSGIIELPSKHGSLGERVTKSAEYRSGKPFTITLPDVSVKALLAGGALTSIDVSADRVVTATSPAFLDFFEIVPTSDGLVRTLRAAVTNAAAPVAEATAATGTSGLKPESDLTFVYDDRPNEMIAHHVSATERILSDATSLRALIDNELRVGVLDTLAAQVAAGSGVRPNLLGIATTPGVGAIASTGDGVGSLVAAIGQVVTVGRRQPNVIGMAPDAWAKLITTAALGSVGLLGRPAILGIPVVPVFGMPSGMAIVGDSTTVTILEQGALEITPAISTRSSSATCSPSEPSCSPDRASPRPSAWVRVDGLPIA